MEKNIYYCDCCLKQTDEFKKIYLTDENINRVRHFCFKCYLDFLKIFKNYDKKISHIKQPNKQKNINQSNTTPQNNNGDLK